MADDTTNVWFPAKRYGWGWGPPRVWQGWAVLSGWLVLLIAAAIAFAGRHWVWYGVSVVVLCVALTAVCWIKGERPQWRD